MLNIYKEAAQLAKARKLVETLRVLEAEKPVPLMLGHTLAMLSNAQWMLLAKVAGVNPPSAETRALAIEWAEMDYHHR